MTVLTEHCLSYFKVQKDSSSKPDLSNLMQQ